MARYIGKEMSRVDGIIDTDALVGIHRDQRLGKFVPVVGEIIADLVQTGTTPHDIALFDLARAAFAGPGTN